MTKLCLKNGLTMEEVALSVGFWIGKFIKISKQSDEVQIKIGELLNKGYYKGLFGDEK